ncbi:hypothetical protein H5410_060560 [Solanum commersonii]|uniref:Uncharacterized protein n=1 Tax=Solanum commersonii TaxID=4109 RepID=A0A9J5W5K2_SOLCO|nr:hypothetical protein H5410_060560 [Solanum commersonii]
MLPPWTNPSLCLLLLWIINVMLMFFLIVEESATRVPWVVLQLHLVSLLTYFPPYPFPLVSSHYLSTGDHVKTCMGSSSLPPFTSVDGFLQV